MNEPMTGQGRCGLGDNGGSQVTGLGQQQFHFLSISSGPLTLPTVLRHLEDIPGLT